MVVVSINTPRLKPEDIDERFDKMEENWGKFSEIRKNIKSLVAKNHFSPTFLDTIISLKDFCDNKKYRKLLKRRNEYLGKHQIMNADEFAKLFWNDNLKNKWNDDNNRLISGKYNKSDINQGILGICVFDTFLKQLKETPFFETLIRCSLQRNEKNNWRKCLIPLCNNEWKYEEISDEDIDYLKNSKYEGKRLISNTSLWFNILETLLVKMIWDKKKYPWLASWDDVEKYYNYNYENMRLMDPENLHHIAYWIFRHNAHDYFLWKDVIKDTREISNFNDEELEWLINLMKTWIIKLNMGVNRAKRDEYIKENIHDSKNNTTMKNGIDSETNEKTLLERWYTLTISHEAWPNENISIWEVKKLWTTFKIKWTNEWFVDGHAYSIEGMHKKNGETFVTIINPRYTWKKIDVPLKYVKEFFDIWIYWFDIDKMFVENEENSEVK